MAASMLVARSCRLLARAPSRLQRSLPAAAAEAPSAPQLTGAASLSTSAGSADYSDFNAVVKTLREVSTQQQQQKEESGGDAAQVERRLPSTKTLKELGHHDLVRAIQKKHGGFVQVAARLGIATTDGDALRIHKQKSSRTNRRRKREQRINKHDFY